jgi:uncharacterized DUF497 family protein
MFEWDNNKNKSNIAKHGISFEQAKQLFDNIHITKIDNRKDYGEVRKISMGIIDEKLIIIVTHTNRNGKIRIISARKASNKEREVYSKITSF